MSARNHIQTEQVIRIYPDFNPKMTGTKMKPIPIKAWETARTLATTPFTSARKQESTPDLDTVEGFSRASENPLIKFSKPQTAAQGIRSRNLNKCKTVTNLQLGKPHTSQGGPRPKLMTRGKSRNQSRLRQFQSIFSSN